MRVLIADDHALFRDGLSLNLERLDSTVVIFQAGSYSQALKILEEEKNLDLVIIDLDMPDMLWEEGLAELRQKSNGARYVIISASEDNRDIRKSLEQGISGYIPKRSDTKVLNAALKLILDGGTYFPPSVLESRTSASKDSLPVERPKSKVLTNRQFEVLSLIAQGMSNKQIAYELGVSEATVKLHINAMLRSLGVNNRTQAVITAQKMGLI